MVEAASARTEIDVRRYWDVLITRWLVIITVAAAGVVLAAGYLIFTPKTYIATTTVSVFPITTDPYAANRNNNSLINMNGEVVLASSFKVAELATSSLGGEWDAAKLRSHTSATAGADSTTMTITVSASSEMKARAGAASVAEAYLGARSDQASKSIESLIDQDSKRIDEYRNDLAEAMERLAKAPSGSSDAADASSDQQIINQQISALVSRISSLQGINTTGGIILNPASATAVVFKPAPLPILLTGLCLGIVVGVILAFVTRPRRKTLRTERDVWRHVAVETLGRITADDDFSPASIAIVAQRLLRLCEVDQAHVLALIFDSTSVRAEVLSGLLTSGMREAGSSAIVADVSDVEDAGPGDVVLVPVRAEGPEATLLHSLRISDFAILVAGIGVTKVRAVARIASMAEHMGTAIRGVILAPGKSPSARVGAELVSAVEPTSGERAEAERTQIRRVEHEAAEG